MKFCPLHDRLLVRRIANSRTAGGIIIPDTAQENPHRGQVIALGAGAPTTAHELVSLDVQVGDHILFGKWSGTEIRVAGEELLIIEERNILGVLETPADCEVAS